MKGRGCGCGCDGKRGTCTAPAPPPAVQRQNATTGRFATAPQPDDDAQFGRSFDRTYDVQAYTGYPTSTVPAGQWNRGILYRQATPVVHLSSPGPMFDRSDPTTWPRRVG